MSIEIQSARCSWIWTEVLPQLASGQAKLDGTLKFLGSKAAFAHRFQEANKPEETLKPGELGVPWPSPRGQLFWHRYLGGRSPGGIDGNAAWDLLVPLRRKEIIPSLRAPIPESRILLESFYYPFGTGFVVTAVFRGSFPVDSLAKWALHLRKGNLEAIDGAGGRAPITLSKFASETMDRLRPKGLPQGIYSAEPFSVSTITQAKGDHLDKVLTQGSDAHGLLETLVRGASIADPKTLGLLAEAMLQTQRQDQNPANALYAGKHGRAIWFPGRFEIPKDEIPTRSLSCYHRNLIFLSLQVDALSGLIRHAHDILQAGTPFSPILESLARGAADQLGRLYAGDASTYQSRSATAQIVHLGMVAPLNAVRKCFTLPPLA